MPKITYPNADDVCAYCDSQAYYISFNSKKKRCCEKITHCPGIIEKQRRSRLENSTPAQRSAIAKNANAAALLVIGEKQKDPMWRKHKSSNISDAVKARGGHSGANNPMYGKTHTTSTSEKMRESAKHRDNTNIGRYVRTPEHRDAQSIRMIDLLQSGKLYKSKDTKPELMFEELLQQLYIPYEKQFLIQYGVIGVNRFRHCYDFRITGTNVLVEIDGDYWHSRPEVILRDKQCVSVANENGFTVIRFLQSELESDICHIGQRLMTEIQ